MTSKEREAEILRHYYAEKWRVGTISKQLGVHKSVVRRVIAQESSPRALVTRRRMVDPFVPLITEMLEKYPTLTASRLYEMVKLRGYAGQESQFRAVISELRPGRNREPFFRLKTIPGEQAQVDWAHFGHVQCGKASRPLMAFVMVLSYSRAVFLHFFLSQNLSHFLYGHELAFRWFGGISRVCLYDNLKSVVLERTGNTIRFNPQFSAYAGHCRFEPRPVAVARGNEKGRVERAIRYIRTSFFAARKFKDLQDLNQQALAWCESTALERPWPQDTSRTVRDIFIEERPHLLSLPETPFPFEERREVSVDKTPYIRFDLNDYSVPTTFVQRILTVVASIDTVRVIDGASVLATHKRSYSRGETIQDEQHLQELKRLKLQAAQHRTTHILQEVAPSSGELLERIAERNLSLQHANAQLKVLLDCYGPELLETAIVEALAHHAPHPHAVRHILERMRQQSGKSPILPLPLPEDPRLEQLALPPHSLTAYDNLIKENKDDDDQ